MQYIFSAIKHLSQKNTQETKKINMENLNHTEALQLIADFNTTHGTKDEVYTVSTRNKKMTVRLTIKKDNNRKAFTRSCIASKFKNSKEFEEEILESLCKQGKVFKSGKTEDSDDDSDEEYKSSEEKDKEEEKKEDDKEDKEENE